MPRFYFQTPGTYAEPDDGLEMDDADTACREAYVAVAAMLQDVAAHGGAMISMEVRDEHGQRACRVTGI